VNVEAAKKGLYSVKEMNQAHVADELEHALGSISQLIKQLNEARRVARRDFPQITQQIDAFIERMEVFEDEVCDLANQEAPWT
jgi:uncharacterized coiled-coil protein SlyX